MTVHHILLPPWFDPEDRPAATRAILELAAFYATPDRTLKAFAKKIGMKTQFNMPHYVNNGIPKRVAMAMSHCAGADLFPPELFTLELFDRN